MRNLERYARVSVAVCDATDPSRYDAVRGRVTNSTTGAGAEHIEALAQGYTGRPYHRHCGRGQVRVILKITADSIHSMDR